MNANARWLLLALVLATPINAAPAPITTPTYWHVYHTWHWIPLIPASTCSPEIHVAIFENEARADAYLQGMGLSFFAKHASNNRYVQHGRVKITQDNKWELVEVTK